jgi:H+/Cl- antiporter ClcA
MWSLISIEFYLITAVVFGLLGRYIAKQKNRSGAEGFWLGVLFSALGVIIVALLPNKEEKSTVLVNKEGLPKDEKTILYVFFILVFLFISFIIYSINNS